MTDNKTTQTFTMFPDFIKSDKQVTNLAKMIYSDIYTIVVQGKKFFASNAWLAEKYATTESTASRAVTNLVKCGYITVHMNVGNDKKVIKRVIKLTNKQKELGKNDNLAKMTSSSKQKRPDELSKNAQGNISSNISINNDADKILRLENELKDESLDRIERSFIERKLADLKGND